MFRESEDSGSNLHRYLSPIGAWALAFGCSVGWGAFVMPGTTFLPLAGPIGTAVGMLIGGAVMLIIAVNYQYMMNRYPDCGGTYSFTKSELGYDQGFMSAWFLILVYMAIVWANATAIPIISKNLFNGALEIGPHYTVAGFDVYLTEAGFASFMIVVASLICIYGGKLLSWIQTILAIVLIGGIVICAVGITLHNGELLTNVRPAYAEGGSGFTQIFRIVALAPWAYVGFESISHSSEEFVFSPKKTLKIFIFALLAGIAAYSLLALIAVAALPEGVGSWPEYISNLKDYSGLAGLPTFNSVSFYLHKPGVVVLGAAVAAGVITGLIGNMVAASRLIYALSRDNLFSEWLGKTNSRRIPYQAIILMTIISLPIPFFGRTAISWIVDVNTIGATLAYGYTSVTAYSRAKKEGNVWIKFTGIVGFLISVIFTLYFLVPNFWSVEALAPASYLILITWSLAGFVVFYYVFRRDRDNRFGHSTAVWLVLLFIVFFITMLWFREVSHNSSERAMRELNEFGTLRLDERGITLDKEESEYIELFLEDKIKQVNDSLLKNSVIQMVIIFVALYIMFNIYASLTKHERQMELEKIKAEENSKAKTMFLSNMSHDIRTPMNAIIGYTELTKNMEGLPEEARQNLEKIDYSSKHLLSLINDVLDMGRIESGKMELELGSYDLLEIFKELEAIFEPQMKGKGIHFTVDTSAIEDRFVMCDANRLNRVLLNLISNAFKFTKENGTVSVTLVQNGKSAKTGNYRISVKDTGIGMSPEFTKTVFEAYTREKSASKIQGTGLGMAITKSIVELAGGTIRVASEKGKGSEFVIDISFDLVPAEEYEKTRKNEQKEEVIDYSNLTIMVVDDVLLNREIACKILKKAGANVDIAENGRIAVDKVASSEPGTYDLILMDIQMPIMNGFEATKEIREIADPKLSSIPIIAMSANAFEEDVTKCRECGMNAHIAKPIEVARMMETIKETLRA